MSINPITSYQSLSLKDQLEDLDSIFKSNNATDIDEKISILAKNYIKELVKCKYPAQLYDGTYRKRA
jgi:hypothetical protein